MHVSQANAISIHHWNARWAWAWKCEYYSFIKTIFSPQSISMIPIICDFSRASPAISISFHRMYHNPFLLAQVINRHFYYLSCWCMTRNKQISWNLRGRRIAAYTQHSILAIFTSSSLILLFMIESFCSSNEFCVGIFHTVKKLSLKL